MSAAAKTQVRMTVDEFLNWEPGDGFRWQLIDGEPRCMSPSSRTHGSIQARLGQLIGNHLEAKGGKCSVIAEPGVIPRLMSKYNMRIPDLAVTCTPYETEEAALADPVLVIEILSPSNHADTWANVWAYTTVPSVQEILVVRTDKIGAELLRRMPGGTWPDRPEVLDGGELTLESIGFEVPLPELYRTTRLARR